MRLIDADTFKEYICNAYEQVKHMYPDGGEWARQITEDFCKAIDEQPTIDISNNSNTLGALDCIDRQEAIKALCREECGMDPKGCCVGTCYDVEIIEDVPSVQLELSNNSPELDNKNGELISRQDAIDAVEHITSSMSVCVNTDECHGMKRMQRQAVIELANLPSTQPDKDLIHLQKEQAYMQGYADGQKPRKGKWIRTRTMTHDGELYCDQCGQEHPEQKIIWNFCPNCGSYNGGEQTG